MQRMPTMLSGDAKPLLGNGNERIPWIVLWPWTKPLGKFPFCKTFFPKIHFSGLECILFYREYQKAILSDLFCSNNTPALLKNFDLVPPNFKIVTLPFFYYVTFCFALLKLPNFNFGNSTVFQRSVPTDGYKIRKMVSLSQFLSSKIVLSMNYTSPEFWWHLRHTFNRFFIKMYKLSPLTGFWPATRVEFLSHLKKLTCIQRAGLSRATQLANFSTVLKVCTPTRLRRPWV